MTSVVRTGDRPRCKDEVGHATLTVRAWDTPRPGQPVTLAVHPVAVQLGEIPAAGTENQFEGIVRAAYFLGRTQGAIVDIAGLEFTAVQVRGCGFAEGEKLPVSIAADAIIPLVTADGAAPLPLPAHQGAARPASLAAHA